MAEERCFMKKRLLALFLALTICFTFTGVFADETAVEAEVEAEAVVEPDELYVEAVEILRGIKVFPNSAKYFENEQIKRSELAEVVFEMIGATDMSQKGARHYVDVKEAHPSYKAIETVSHIKLMGGHGEGMFEPDAYATYNEVIKTMVCAINFQKYAEVKGGYPTGYLVAANNQDMLDNLELNSSSQYITGRDFSILVLNTLRAGIMTETSYTDDGETLKETGTNLLLEKHKIIEVKGVLEGNGMSNIYGDEPDLFGNVVIAGKTYKCDCDATMLGYKVSAFVKDTNGDKIYDTAIYIKKLVEDNKVTIINAEEIYGYGSYQYTYGNNKKIKITANTNVLYNGKRMNLYDENLMVPEKGYVEFISNDGNNTYDVMFIHDQQTIFVKSASAENGFVGDTYDSSNFLRVDLEDEKIDFMLYKGSDEVTFLQIAVGNVLTVETSQDGRCIRAFLSQDKVEGTLTAKGENSVVIEGVEYPAHSAFVNALETKIGDYGSYALDINGYVAGKIVVASDPWMHGVVLAIGAKGTLEQSLQIRMFTQNGDEVVYDFADRVTLDGVKLDETATIADGTNKIQSVVNSSHDPYMQRIPFNEEDDSANVQKRLELPIVVRVLTNDNNEITHIDTLYDNSNGGYTSYDVASDTFKVMDAKVNRSYNGSAYTFSGQTLISGTTIIRINPNLTGDVEEDYKVIAANAMKSNTSYTYESFKNKDDALTPRLLLTYFAGSGSEGIDDLAKFMIVDRVQMSLDKEGEECYAVYGLYNDLKQEILFKSDIKPTDIKSGDIIRFGLSQTGHINGYERILDGTTQKLAYPTNPYGLNNGSANTSIGSDYCVALGDVWANDNGIVVFTTDYEFNGTTDLTSRPDGSLIVNLGSAPVYIYEKLDNGKIDLKIGNKSNIVGYLDDSANPSKILIHTHWYMVQQVFIIK